MAAKSARTVLAVGASVLFAACSLPIPHEELVTPFFYGTVRDLQSGKPIAGVSVELNTSDKRFTAKTVTDDSGYYELGVTKRIKWLVINPLAEGGCEGAATFSHSNYERISVKEDLFGRATFSSPCKKTRHDVVMKRLPSNSAAQSDAFHSALGAPPHSAPGRER